MGEDARRGEKKHHQELDQPRLVTAARPLLRNHRWNAFELSSARDPWALAVAILGDSLHPGGLGATGRLLDLANLRPGARLLDVGCGTGASARLGTQGGLSVVAFDASRSLLGDRGAPRGRRIRARVPEIPIRSGSVDAVLSECVVCALPDPAAALRAFHDLLGPGAKLLLSDVTVERPLHPSAPAIASLLCLRGACSRAETVRRIKSSGFEIQHFEDRTADLVALRDRVMRQIDVASLLDALGPRFRVEAAWVGEVLGALDCGDLGYASLVAARK